MCGSHFGRAVPCGAALLLFLITLISGCREEGLQSIPATSAPLHVKFSPDASFAYDVWKLDQSGRILDSTKVHHLWHVRETAASCLGFNDVTVVVDSLVVPAGLATLDTLWFRFLPSGDIYEYRFTARLVSILEGGTIAGSWDVIAAVSGGLSTTWTVGTTDSAGTTPLYGTLLPDQVYLQVAVNQQQTLIPAYRVDITGETVNGSLLLADVPPSFPYMRWEGGIASRDSLGELWVLTDVQERAQ